VFSLPYSFPSRGGILENKIAAGNTITCDKKAHGHADCHPGQHLSRRLPAGFVLSLTVVAHRGAPAEKSINSPLVNPD